MTNILIRRPADPLASMADTRRAAYARKWLLRQQDSSDTTERTTRPAMAEITRDPMATKAATAIMKIWERFK